MPTNLEVRVEQRRRLFSLLKIKKANGSLEIKELDNEIAAVEAEMSQEDVAWVREKIVQLK